MIVIRREKWRGVEWATPPPTGSRTETETDAWGWYSASMGRLLSCSTGLASEPEAPGKDRASPHTGWWDSLESSGLPLSLGSWIWQGQSGWVGGGPKSRNRQQSCGWVGQGCWEGAWADA